MAWVNFADTTLHDLMLTLLRMQHVHPDIIRGNRELMPFGKTQFMVLSDANVAVRNVA